ncbi:hypothetical protein C1H46_002020 [Malus baccata]|uniref:Uncharacterized protein n=1 Tax=Malus baccata TaxID=106549 RepID=A0A540NMW0_MALBA|nr:hypothetical protein C1H46_002020 [Malus baccata]
MPSLSAFSVTLAMVRNAIQSNMFVKADEWVEVQRSHICFLSRSPTIDHSGMGVIILHMEAVIFVVVLGGVVIGMVGTVVIVYVHGGRFGKDRRLRG